MALEIYLYILTGQLVSFRNITENRNFLGGGGGIIISSVLDTVMLMLYSRGSIFLAVSKIDFLNVMHDVAVSSTRQIVVYHTLSCAQMSFFNRQKDIASTITILKYTVKLLESNKTKN